jgi:hypothetical protein
MRELPLGMKRLEDGEEWRTLKADSDGGISVITGSVEKKNEGGGGRREATTLLTGSRSHVNPFGVTCHAVVFGVTVVPRGGL